METTVDGFSEKSHLVTVRFWPGFNNLFPFEEVDDLPFLGRDVEKTLAALRRIVAAKLWKSRKSVRAGRRRRKANWIAAVQKQSLQRLGDDFANRPPNAIGSRQFLTPRRDKLDHTFGVMTELGLARSSGLRGSGPCVSPRIPIIAAADPRLAECIADQLASIPDINLRRLLPRSVASVLEMKATTTLEFFLPRFKTFAVSQLSPTERAVAYNSLSYLESAEDVTLWAQVVNVYRGTASDSQNHGR